LSHDIRTPINAIFAVLDFIKDTNLDDSQMNFVNTLNSEAQFLFTLINDILDFSKIEADKMEFEEIPFDLSVMIEDMAYGLALMAEKKGLEVISFVSPDTPLLIGDPSRLRQIIMNLTSNALKFTNQGEIYIKAEVIEELGDRVKIRIAVKDTGIGIPKDQHEKIFESFTQADVSTTRRYGGTGLGTTIAKKLTELMGGEIGLKSEVGKGSTFWFSVILKKQKEYKVIPSKKEVDLTGLKFLIVDPSQTSRLSLSEYLKSMDCKIVGVSQGKEALTMLRDSVSLQEPFDLILINLQMTDMYGFDLAKLIRSIDMLKEVPIILLTSAGNIGDAQTCKEIGVNAYLTKPIRQAQLFDAIKSVLRIATVGEYEPQLVTRHTIAEDSRKKLRILLAEDYPTNQLVAKKHLEIAGYQVDLAENGHQAIEAFKQNHYDLIFMDVEMPVMNGYDSTKALRDTETSRGDIATRVPIIAMTAHDMKSDKERCSQAGMDDFIAKPLNKIDLLAMVDKWVLEKGVLKKDLGQDAPDDEIKKEDSPMNFEKALREFEGNREILMELLWKLIEDVKDQIGKIHKAIHDGNIEVVKREAHTIKGGASMLTANDLSSVASELEQIAKAGSLEGSTEIIERIEKEFNRLEDYVRIRSLEP
jgi:CheY-like chemotaxis protein/HPt (histidine-containing phosphotransfer) domain-containing protein